MRPYPIPAEATRFTEEIKKSRFITLLAPTSGVEAAKAFIQQVRDEHPAEVHHHLRETLAEVVQRRRQPLNAAVAFDGDAQRGLMRLVAGLQRLLDLREDLLRQLQQDLALGSEAQGLALAHEQLEAQTLLKIAELVRQGRLRLVKLGRRPRQRTAVAQGLQRP